MFVDVFKIVQGIQAYSICITHTLTVHKTYAGYTRVIDAKYKKNGLSYTIV